MIEGLVLSLFPGLGLLDRAFELEGYTILRGSDWLWGGDIRNDHYPRGIFDGVIGGAPCPKFSTLYPMSSRKGEDLIGEFVRIVEECHPKWAVMENVLGARKSPHIPKDWHLVILRDWDCGGLTMRKRGFWIYPPTLIMQPPRRAGRPSYSVLAHSHLRHSSSRHKWRGHELLSVEEAAKLQGFPELAGKLKGIGKPYAMNLLGNGVPKALGLYIAKAIKQRSEGER